jgi:hypothetical protein
MWPFKRKEPVFRHINIIMSGPICTCDESNLAWDVKRDRSTKKVSFVISCQTCKTKLVVPQKKFLAGFVLDRPYPGKKQDTEEEHEDTNQKDGPKLTVLEFPSEEEREDLG